MATYDSIHTGTAVDQAVERTLANKSKGDSSTPIYLDANGEAVAITKSTVPTEDDNKLITSGAMYTELAAKYNKADIATSADLGTSTTLIPSQKAVKSYADKVFSGVQPTVVAGSNIVKTGNELSVNPDGLMNPDEITGKREHYGEYVVGYDSEVLEKVERARHSSFDLSKFTVVGSPNITDDGIASGFSSSNYLKTVNFQPTATQSWKIECSFNSGDLASTNTGRYILGFSGDSGHSAILFQQETNALSMYLRTENSASIFLSLNYNSAVSNTNYKMTLESDGNYTYTAKILDSRGIVLVEKSETNSTALNFPNQTLDLGFNGWNYFTGSIDLKQFSITVDGIPVFSGNKTGIDTIKPDDYTVVGTPTISADGIISGMSDSNYVSFSLPQTITSNDAFELTMKFNIGTWAAAGVQASAIIYGDTFPYLQFYNSRLNLGGDSSTGTKVFSENEEVTLKWVRQGGTNNIYYLNTNNEFVLDYIFEDSSNYFGTVWLGNSIYQNRFMGGSIDLNSFKIYVDGNLVYQPCLKIPYTLTKDGKKIVDHNYRSRVEDEYTQATFTPYYTLQSENKGNYQVVGSPTISSDFVASGFSGTSYLQSSVLNINNCFDFELISPVYKFDEMISGYQDLFLSTSYADTYIETFMELQASSIIVVVKQSYNEILRINTGWMPNINDTFQVKLKYKNNQWIVYRNINNEGWTAIGSPVSDTNGVTINNSVMKIGCENSDIYLHGDANLNAFKIYVDNELAYEAVIPPNYTMATNKPQDIIYTYQNGANKYIQRANLQLEEYGTCTSGTAVTFQKPFRDDNYALTVPYSAKSKTGFTPSQTGDWKAKGFYSL